MYTLRQNYGSALNVPRDDGLGGGYSQVRRNLLDLEIGISELGVDIIKLDPYDRQFKGLLNLFVASEWRVSLEKHTVKFSPLLEPQTFIRCQGGRGPNRDTHSEQFRLWISKAQFDLVYSWAVLEGIGGQVLVSARLSQVTRKTLERVTHLHTLKLSTQSVLCPGGTDVVDVLADTNISYLAFINQFFEFLPSRVRILSQRFVNDSLPLFLVRFLFKRNRPTTQSSTSKTATDECSAHQ